MSIEQNPMTKLVKFYETTLIFIDRVEELFYIRNGDIVLFEDGFGFVELFQRQFFVVVFVDLVEDGPVYVVVFDVLNEVWELCLRHKVIPELGHCLHLWFGGVEAPFDHGTERKEIGKFHNVLDSPIDFCKTEVPIFIFVKLGPITLQFLFGFRCVLSGQLLLDSFDNLSRLNVHSSIINKSIIIRLNDNDSNMLLIYVFQGKLCIMTF